MPNCLEPIKVLFRPDGAAQVIYSTPHSTSLDQRSASAALNAAVIAAAVIAIASRSGKRVVLLLLGSGLQAVVGVPQQRDEPIE